MVELSQLWLPILLSGAAVFFLSFLMWMVSPHHRKDWDPVPDEDGIMDHIRSQGLGGGQYTFPFCAEPSQWKDPAMIEKYNRGPKGFLILFPDGPQSMGKKMGISFVFNLITALLVAYVATMGVEAGADARFVFRFVWVVAFLANSFGLVWGSIWFSRTWGSTMREMFDGLVYSAATGAIFAWMWPAL